MYYIYNNINNNWLQIVGTKQNYCLIYETCTLVKTDGKYYIQLHEEYSSQIWENSIFGDLATVLFQMGK